MRNMTRLGLVAGLGLFLAGCVDDGYRGGGGGYSRGYYPGYASGPVYRGPAYRAPTYYAPPPRRDWGGRDYRRDDRRDDRRARSPGPPPPQRQGPPPQQRRDNSGDAMRNLLDRNR